jgi:carboxypeptidase T
MRDHVPVPFAPLAILGLASALAWPVSPTRVAIRVPAGTPIESIALDTWSELGGASLDVVVPAAVVPLLGEHELLDADIDATAHAERSRLASRATKGWFDEYRDFTEVTARMRSLAELAPDRVSMHEVGRSIEGRAIWALAIGHGDTKMLVNGTQHAREWISTMVTTCVADRLVREYDTNPAVRRFVDTTQLWIVPIVNPDGYQHAWSSNRYWRKNRRGTHGVDLNRNWGVAWGGAGSSGSERSEVYRGTSAFSEPETRALRDLALREHFNLHVDFHSYSQLVMYPWCYTQSPPKDRDRLRALGDGMASALYAAHGTRYDLVQCGGAAGTMTDWTYGEAKATSFIIELRPKGGGRNGFVLPPEQIRPTCDEGFGAVLALRSRAIGRAQP